ncbi:hypothetical protein EJ06DRAFT_384141 [Trichodelitschia bisporula]|uniref:SET domain-containing protein n=1 Tax=Trichodelitschia bisporula TaxID=703511 RepID=A0A6G1HZ29_9PEZI|nr:hypothetical protein EJ06DRAFT_384141 [Trichodelitschia bisporula]
MDKDVFMLFDRMARINHSCRPNVYVGYCKAHRRATTHAIRDIEKGEELVLSILKYYGDVYTREEVCEMHSFRCRCELFDKNAPTFKETETTWWALWKDNGLFDVLMKYLVPDVPDDPIAFMLAPPPPPEVDRPPFFAAMCEVCQSMVGRLESLGMGEDDKIRKWCNWSSYAAEANGDLAKAVRYRLRALNIDKAIKGEDHEDYFWTRLHLQYLALARSSRVVGRRRIRRSSCVSFGPTS